ncbi:MAG: hypothetical protein HKM93_17185 [Desulfobacteraceae bacterium]|nr:hypothetical protein [Desulfobacteraceae bacterium]
MGYITDHMYNKIRYFFVTAQAGQMFTLMVIPFVSFIILPAQSHDMFLSKTILLSGLWVMLFWLYSVGSLIYEKYADFLDVPIGRFKVCMGYIVIYPVFYIYDIIPMDYLLPLHIVSIMSNIFALYFTAKLIVTVERKRKVRFQDYTGTFIAAWFYVVGIWFLQPRINNIFRNNDENKNMRGS